MDTPEDRVCKTLDGHIDTIAASQYLVPPTQNGHCIPQRPYSKGAHRSDPANQGLEVFILEDGSYIPVTEAIDGIYRGLIRRDEPALSEAGHTITLRFEWPGYPSKDYQLRTLDWCRPPNKLPLSKLSTEVGKLVNKFVNEIQIHVIDPQHAHWMISPRHIWTENLSLAALEQVSAGSWQPRLFYKPSH